MLLDATRARQWLKAFDFKPLFIEGLGWDRHTSSLQVAVDAQTVTLSALANKRGMVAYLCSPSRDGNIPDYPTRRKIEMQTAKAVREHLIIYTDADKSTQVWQWVKREAGKPLASREHTFHRNQSGDSLFQKLEAIAFSIAEEETLTLVDVTSRVRAGFDLERVTKRFYDRFKTEHDAFLKFLDGIPTEEMERWYVSVMLNRLMFIYFIQKKGFLDGDTNYLRNRLAESKKRGKDRFYKDLLCPLFFEGFAKKERSAAANALLGKVPYLNGGIFQRHQIEELHGNAIEIPDSAFVRLFEFFDQYQWHLDERPLRADNEINPDVLGYIFEKYINQKQMGAYYTKEDITGYISQNTVIPFLFDAARAFNQTPLQVNPDRYIYDAVKHGATLPLPPEIAAGLNNVSKRTDWNKPAPAEYALPTEIWREVVARRKRFEEVRAKLANGEIRDINDFITYNLNIRQFAQDVIQNIDDPALLRAFWHVLEQVSVLDPTVGSGAFLFAALNILESLYEACLERMQAFVDETETFEVSETSKVSRGGFKKYGDFRKILARVAQHPNRKYFVYKSIVVNNLYGVDIMEEAVEICKLRLFLKLVAQVESADKIEPLPDIDFNIRAGNSLVGFATYDEVRKAVLGDAQGKMDFDNDMQRIDERAEIADRAFKRFREMQTEHGMNPKDFTETKNALRERLNKLEDDLNRYLAKQYGVDPNKKAAFEKWRASHRPFHWFIEFYGILKQGGFDVIIGNPPYVEYGKVKSEYAVRGYATESCGNLYALVIERCFDALRTGGLFGMIVQLPIVCTDRMKPLQGEFLDQSRLTWFANFDDRPAKLFDGLQHIRATIFTAQKGETKSRRVYSTTYNRWYSDVRSTLFEQLAFESVSDYLMDGAIPKIGHPLAKVVRKRIADFTPLGRHLVGSAKHPVYFHNSPQYWIRAMTFIPYFWNERGGEQMSSHVKTLSAANRQDASIVAAALNSSLFYWWFILFSNCRDLVMREIEAFPIGLEQMSEATKSALAELTSKLMADYKRHALRKETEYQTTGKVIYDEFYPRYSKPIIDEIDRVLAKHYKFTDEELDFIINYDIKYRMGREGEDADEA